MEFKKKYGYITVKAKHTAESSVLRNLYLRSDKNPNHDPRRPKDRTLLVANVPAYVYEESIRAMFDCCGTVEDVFLCKHLDDLVTSSDDSKYFPSNAPVLGYKLAYVVFSSSKALTKAFLIDKPLLFCSAQHRIVSGVKKWVQDYKDAMIDSEDLVREVDVYLKSHDINVLEEETVLKSSVDAPDEDGWVKVTKYSKNKGASRAEAHDTRIKDDEKAKRQEKELFNFYKFQIRDTKKQHIEELRERFEQDKRKVAEMKSARKFRPY